MTPEPEIEEILAEIEALLGKATPEPVHARPPFMGDANRDVHDPNGCIASFWSLNDADLELAVSLRNAAPRLVRELRAAREALEEIRDEAAISFEMRIIAKRGLGVKP